ncbi:hypothetical protein GBAR_LOCUS11054 [Geodia barretti]|uniref:Transposase n=1 Tax=Geodia barretti TaxID=519541 RepID=A0AA35RW06_GEOBA|nr:hypothetical protein GBAR_LOCUS11054 [Geodia barretti]
MLPHDLPPWRIVFHYFRTWRRDGTWQRVHGVLHAELRQAQGRQASPSAAIIDTIYGEEIAIRVTIATDPDCWVPTDEEFARARPASEAVPEIVAAYHAAKTEEPNRVNIEIALDADVLQYFRDSGPGWQARINDILRRTMNNPIAITGDHDT